jgi:hypothetical protein
MNRLVLIFFLGIIIFHPCYNIKKNIKIILFLLGLIYILQKSEGFGNIDAEALQNMASLYNSSTGILKVNNIEASGYISTNQIKPTDKTKGLNILGPNDQSLYFTEGQAKYIDLINTNIHIAGNRKPVIAGQEPDKYNLFVSMPSEFRENIVAKKNITETGNITANRIDTNTLNGKNNGYIAINGNKKGTWIDIFSHINFKGHELLRDDDKDEKKGGRLDIRPQVTKDNCPGGWTRIPSLNGADVDLTEGTGGDDNLYLCGYSKNGYSYS